ncbi:MAG: HAD family hydrolase [Flexilinea sp.]|nr:HAD family hydrolase [Flexilinea sp.]
MNENIKAIVFDLGGTLRIALKDEEWMRQGRINMAKLAGTDLPFEDFYALVEERYEKYREWALDVNRESNDEELWCKWLLYDYPKVRIFANRHKLSYEYRQAKGRRVVVDHGEEVLKELYRRGYKLGIISNLIGETEVYDWLDADGLLDLFDSVILSPECGLRKPDAEIYRVSSRDLGIPCENIASIADNQGRDIEGAREAGIACNVLYNSPEKKHPVDPNGENPPDAVVNDFRELLDLFPPREAA